MEKEMNYPKNIVFKIRQHIEETNRRRMNPANIFNKWEQFDKWDQGSEWTEINSPPWGGVNALLHEK